MKDFSMLSRRKMLGGTGAISAAVAAAAVSKVAMAALPEPVIQAKPDTMPPLVPYTGRPYNPVVTLNGWTLPWRMNQGVKEFHLVAEPVVREMTAGFKAHLWGYNGMLIGVFELLADARVQIAGVNAAIESLRDFWIAQADLDMALIGKPSLAAMAGPATTAEAGGGGH